MESNECTGNLNEDELLKDRETRGGGGGGLEWRLVCNWVGGGLW